MTTLEEIEVIEGARPPSAVDVADAETPLISNPTKIKANQIDPTKGVIHELTPGATLSPGDIEEPRAPSAASVADAEAPLIPKTIGESEEESRSQPRISQWCGRTRYDNPWDTWRGFFQKVAPVLKWKLCNLPNFSPPEVEADKELPVLEKDVILAEIKPKPESNQVRVTWLGHASVLLQFETANVLCDPVFSSRIGPLPLPLISYSRYRRPPLEVDDLPDIDAVVISHNHYDHLDLTSVQNLHERFGAKIHWFVPEGLKEWMCNLGIEQDNVTESTWWRKHELEEKGITFTFTPTQHWCLRSGFDRNQVLWGSWAICSKRVKTWFGGDTGYCETFKEIGKEFGGFHFSAIPIGAFLPRDVMKDQHVEPKESVMIHKDLKSQKSLGIHWGTFTMGCIERYMDPKEWLEHERSEAGIPEDDFFVLHHGGSKTITASD